jgi:nucleoside-diphosphate-sugar epimerase
MTHPSRGTAGITGASGYLGSVIRERLGASGWSCIDLVRRPAGPMARRYSYEEDVSPDLLDGLDVLVHCAYDMTARHRDDIWRINVDGTRRLLDAADQAGVPRTIVLSSMSAYDGTEQLYGRAKVQIERDADVRGAVAVRPGLVYGPNAGGMTGAIASLTRLPVVPVFAARSHQFTVHEDDFASAIEALATAESATLGRGAIGVANPVPVPFRQVVEGLARMHGRTCRTVAIDWRAARLALRMAERIGLDLPFRSDSLLGLAAPATVVPRLEVLESLGITLRRFGQPVPAPQPPA